MIVATIALCFLALTVEGVMPMIAAFVINLATHLTIEVGSRVEGIAVSNTRRLPVQIGSKIYCLTYNYLS